MRRDDLYWSLWPNSALDRLAPHVVWDAFDDDLRTACAHGRLIVLSDLPAEVPSTAQMLIDIIGVRRRGIQMCIPARRRLRTWRP